MKIKIRFLHRIITVLMCLAILGCGVVTILNSIVTLVSGSRIITTEEAAKLTDIDCILVLGCQVKDDGTPSHMLEDRLKRGVELFEAGASAYLLMSGDHGRQEYDEVGHMKKYAVDAGVRSSAVFLDHAGFSTYESIYRAKEIFGADRILVVTQEYHLYRALYIAKSFGIEAWGVAADYREYSGQFNRDVREVLARVKDLGMCIFKPKPTYLGEAVPLSGSGDVTNDGSFVYS